MNISSFSHNTDQQQDTDHIRMCLKWFNASKGFGFLVPDDPNKEHFDAFLHITTLQSAGLNALGEGAILECTIEDGQKGKQIKDIINVIDKGAINMMTHSQNEDGTITLGGLVKWYKPEKGFGFIIADDGLKDIFVHKSLLDKLEIDSLEEGQRVKVTIKAVDKGREAVHIESAQI